MIERPRLILKWWQWAILIFFGAIVWLIVAVLLIIILYCIIYYAGWHLPALFGIKP